MFMKWTNRFPKGSHVCWPLLQPFPLDLSVVPTTFEETLCTIYVQELVPLINQWALDDTPGHNSYSFWISLLSDKGIV